MANLTAQEEKVMIQFAKDLKDYQKWVKHTDTEELQEIEVILNLNLKTIRDELVSRWNK